MSIAARARAAAEAAEVTTPGGWRVRFRLLLPAHLLLGPCADDARAWLSIQRLQAETVQALSDPATDPEVLAELRAQVLAAGQDRDNAARAQRLYAAAIAGSVTGLGAPEEEIEAVQVGEVEDLSATPPVIAMPTLAAMLGPDFAWLQEVALYRAVGGEAGQKAAITFCSLASALVARKAGKSVGMPPVGADPGQHGGLENRPDML